jgi:hypothetical protein
MTVGFIKEALYTCCGVDEIGEFYRADTMSKDDFYDELKISPSHSGLSIAVFIDNEACHKAYELLKNKFTILYQSPCYRNRGSGNMLFLVVYFEGK